MDWIQEREREWDQNPKKEFSILSLSDTYTSRMSVFNGSTNLCLKRAFIASNIPFFSSSVYRDAMCHNTLDTPLPNGFVLEALYQRKNRTFSDYSHSPRQTGLQ